MAAPNRKAGDDGRNPRSSNRRSIPSVKNLAPPSAAGWTRQERLIASVAGVAGIALLGFAVYGNMAPNGKTRSTSELPADRATETIAENLSVAALTNSPASTAAIEPAPTATLEPQQESVGTTTHEATRKTPHSTANTSPANESTDPLQDSPQSGVPATDQPSAPANQETAVAPREQNPTPAVAGAPVPQRAAAEQDKSQNNAAHDAVSIDDADDYDSSGAEDFVCPVPWLKDSKIGDRVKYMNALQGLLKAGWGDKPADLETARGHFESARRLCNEDPRVGYAFGLVLWKHGQPAAARREWEAATHIGTHAYLPALSVVAWSSLLDHDEAAGFAAIERAAAAVTQEQGDYPTPAQRMHATLFLGRAIGFLKGPGLSLDLNDQVQRTEQKLIDGLSEDLRKTFLQGQSQATRRFEQFKHLAERSPADVADELHKEQDRLADESATLRQELKKLDDRRRQIPSEARVKSTKLGHESKLLENKIDRWSAEIMQGNATADELSKPRRILDGYRQETKKVWVKDRDHPNGGRWETDTKEVAVYRAENAQEIQSRYNERTTLLQRLRSGSQELAQFQDRYQAIPLERNELARQYRQEKLETGRAAGALRRRLSELASIERDLLKDFVTPEEMRKRMTSLTPYVPWNLDTDREGLLASYRPKAAAHTPATQKRTSPVSKKPRTGSR